MSCFRILGPIDAVDGDRRLVISGRRQLALLAYLLLHPNEPVSSDAVSDAVWGRAHYGGPHRLPMAIARMRKALAALDGNSDGRLRTVSGGYMLAVASGELDADVFSSQVRAGRQALLAGEAVSVGRVQPDGEVLDQPQPDQVVARP